MRLNDSLITDFNFNNSNYPIDLSFDNVLDVFDVLNDNDLNEDDKLDIALTLLINEEVTTLHFDEKIELWRFILDNYISINDEYSKRYDLYGNELPPVKQTQTIDLEKDAKFIYASFLQAYNINLFKEHRKMHWAEFSALLSALPENTIMQQIIHIRQWKPKKHDSSEYKSAMRELQRKYTLETDNEEVGTYG